METTDYSFYYDEEVTQHQFLAIPKMLMTSKRFKNLSSDAKLLFALFLDRAKVSMKNNWFDKEGRLFIIYRIESVIDENGNVGSSITEDLGVSKNTATRAIKELSNANLIFVKRQGLGKPNLIYVKNFAKPICNEEGSVEEEHTKKQSIGARPWESRKYCETKESNESDEVLNEDSRIPNFGNQESQNLTTNNTNINNTKINNSISISEAMKEKPEESPELKKEKLEFETEIEERINDSTLEEIFPSKKKLIKELPSLIADYCYSQEEFKVKGKVYKRSEILKRFKKLDAGDIEFAIHSLDKLQSEGKLSNTRRYLLAVLVDKAGSLIGTSTKTISTKNTFTAINQGNYDIDALEARLLSGESNPKL